MMRFKDLKKKVLTGLAGLAIGASAANGGATIRGHEHEYEVNNPRNTTLIFFLADSKIGGDDSFFSGIYNYKVSLWENEGGSKGEYLGSNSRLETRLGSSNVFHFWGDISLYPILQNATNWNPSEGLYFELNSIKSPFRHPGASFPTYSGILNYTVPQGATIPQSVTTNSSPIPEPSTLGLLALGATALKKYKNAGKQGRRGC